jgi:CDP-diacylglycerol--glycerol-3-phosphate 3-phosphatidyltransferase
MERNLPNALTVSRVLVTPLVCLLIFLATPTASWLALVAYLYACVTDFLDGYLARSRQQLSNFGRMLDPIADKLLVASILLILVAVDRLQAWNLIPAAVILWREILVSGLREYLAELQVSVPVTRLAKWKTTLQLIAIGFLVVGDVLPLGGGLTATDVGIVGLWLAAALTVLTGYDYLRAGLRHLADAPYPAVHPGLNKIDSAREV